MMMRICLLVLLSWVLCPVPGAYAIASVRAKKQVEARKQGDPAHASPAETDRSDGKDAPFSPPPDTLKMEYSERTTRFYDSIEVRRTRKTLGGRLLRSLSRSAPDTTSNYREVNEFRRFEPYKGKTIRQIVFDRHPVFSPAETALERYGNKVHHLTRESAIRRDLLFRPGDPLDAEELVINQQLLRDRRYFSDVAIEVRPDSVDDSVVDLVLRTSDRWTISADGSLSWGGPTSIELYDANMLGYGNRLSVTTSFDWRNGHYGGNRVEYEIPNFLGSFYEAYLIAGKRFESSDLGGRLKKDFITPEDYMLGAEARQRAMLYYLLFADSSMRSRNHYFDGWGGYSHYLSGINSSLYATARYLLNRNTMRPDVGPRYNPVFHNTDLLLSGFGLYRERFYSANLIQGYGVREYLAGGYRAEVTLGYEWGEFDNSWYLGMRYSVGGYSRKGGYWMGSAMLGSYINPNTGKWHSSGADVDLRYFSKLMKSGRFYIRQFLRVNFTRGWNRYEGADEVITFTSERGPMGLDVYVIGNNRANLDAETVFFTPWQPYGFRVALFGFVDVSVLGNRPDLFENAFFSTVGIGIRVKNERLIFNAVQLRLSVAFGRSGLLKSEYVRFSNQQRVWEYRFLPGAPETVPFR